MTREYNEGSERKRRRRVENGSTAGYQLMDSPGDDSDSGLQTWSTMVFRTCIHYVVQRQLGKQTWSAAALNVAYKFGGKSSSTTRLVCALPSMKTKTRRDTAREKEGY